MVITTISKTVNPPICRHWPFALFSQDILTMPIFVWDCEFSSVCSHSHSLLADPPILDSRERGQGERLRKCAREASETREVCTGCHNVLEGAV